MASGSVFFFSYYFSGGERKEEFWDLPGVEEGRKGDKKKVLRLLPPGALSSLPFGPVLFLEGEGRRLEEECVGWKRGSGLFFLARERIRNEQGGKKNNKQLCCAWKSVFFLVVVGGGK